MRIGFDFDNTIVSYDALFYKVACEQNLLPPNHDIARNKLQIRDYLREIKQEETWTMMQGYVYGKRMAEAQIFPHVLAVLKRLKEKGHELAIISHKTQFPYLGPQYDLHASARDWIENELCHADGSKLFANQHIFFEVTKDEKLSRIAHFNCDVFIDDLPEILLAKNFPQQTTRILFDPEQHHDARQINDDIKVVTSWKDLVRCLEV